MYLKLCFFAYENKIFFLKNTDFFLFIFEKNRTYWGIPQSETTHKTTSWNIFDCYFLKSFEFLFFCISVWSPYEPVNMKMHLFKYLLNHWYKIWYADEPMDTFIKKILNEHFIKQMHLPHHSKSNRILI